MKRKLIKKLKNFALLNTFSGINLRKSWVGGKIRFSKYGVRICFFPCENKKGRFSVEISDKYLFFYKSKGAGKKSWRGGLTPPRSITNTKHIQLIKA